MKHPKVTVGLILFKDTTYLSWSLPSLLNQDYPHIKFIIRDQSPEGEVYEWLKQNHPEFFEKATISKADNVMHSGGQNAMIRQMTGDLYFCVGGDMLYPPNFVSRIVEEMQQNEAHVATCKVMQWNFEEVKKDNLHGSKTTKIDSFGIGISKNHHLFDRGQGMDENDFVEDGKILGPSGTLAVFSKKALEAVAYKNHKGKLEYFDENLHYKNDCDLAYRLSWAGFKTLLVDIKVYHDRQLGEKSKGALQRLKDHHQKAKWAKESSLLGHLVTLKKNFDPRLSFMVKLKTKLSLIARYLYTLFFAPSMLRTYKKVQALESNIQDRKKHMKKNVTAKEMESLMA